jgi:hypothetical protein
VLAQVRAFCVLLLRLLQSFVLLLYLPLFLSFGASRENIVALSFTLVLIVVHQHGLRVKLVVCHAC